MAQRLTAATNASRPIGLGLDAKLAAEYAATAEAWRVFCDRGKVAGELRSAPTSVLLLYATAEAETWDATHPLSGDVILDALLGLRVFVRSIERSATRGG